MKEPIETEGKIWKIGERKKNQMKKSVSNISKISNTEGSLMVMNHYR